MANEFHEVARRAEERVFRNALSELTEPYVSQKQAAELLHVSVSTLVRWKRNGQGPSAIRVGGRVRYRLDHLRSFLFHHESAAGSLNRGQDDA